MLYFPVAAPTEVVVMYIVQDQSVSKTVLEFEIGEYMAVNLSLFPESDDILIFLYDDDGDRILYNFIEDYDGFQIKTLPAVGTTESALCGCDDPWLL